MSLYSKVRKTPNYELKWLHQPSSSGADPLTVILTQNYLPVKAFNFRMQGTCFVNIGDTGTATGALNVVVFAISYLPKGITSASISRPTTGGLVANLLTPVRNVLLWGLTACAHVRSNSTSITYFDNFDVTTYSGVTLQVGDKLMLHMAERNASQAYLIGTLGFFLML